jgi:hypothetical protein
LALLALLPEHGHGAILDRVVHNAHRMHLRRERLRRKCLGNAMA